MSGEHYFTAEPTGPGEYRSLRVTLAGHPVMVQTAPGVFSPRRVDPGTAVLLDHVPAPAASGALLDLGCGWGPLALSLGLLSPSADVFAVDVNARALELVRRNAAALGLPRVRASLPDEVPAEVRFALIWSNPPIRVGKAALHELLRRWLVRLADDGTAYLVVQRNLGSDSLQRWIADELGMPCERTASSRGFRVLRVRPPG
ncbi:MAG: class I SAM-dependent methyltransferase [Dermatophilaceae bacterium]